MPLHDWTRVEDREFHSFHSAWMTHLCEELNDGGLPEGFYSLQDAHAGAAIGDVLALSRPEVTPKAGTVLTAPVVSRRLSASPARQRSVVVRRAIDRRIVAVIELVSRGNFDRPGSVKQFAAKVNDLIASGVNVLVIDLFPPGKHTPRGLSERVWRKLSGRGYKLPDEACRTIASFVSAPEPEVMLEHPHVGDKLPAMPLYLTPSLHIKTPLPASYDAAFRGLPQVVRDQVAG